MGDRLPVEGPQIEFNMHDFLKMGGEKADATLSEGSRAGRAAPP